MAAAPRFFCDVPLASGDALALPPAAARHVQVLRLQPGRSITLFDGRGGEYAAVIERMGRSDVEVLLGAHDPVEREAARGVYLAVGLMASERMDWLVEKATELGAAGIQPLLAERSVLRLAGERAAKRVAHWQAIAVAACEQCGRNRVPAIAPLRPLDEWLAQPAPGGLRLLLSLSASARPLGDAVADGAALTLLSGPEGGLSGAEESSALGLGFVPATLGPRVLRAETAPLAALARLT